MPASSMPNPPSGPAKPRTLSARHLVRAASSAAATTLWLALLGVITTPYMLEHLGAAAYGVFALITIVSSYLSNLEFGFGHALVRFTAIAHASHNEREERRVMETSLGIFCIASVVGAGTAFALAPVIVHDYANVPPTLREDAVTAMRLGSVILLFVLLSTYCSSVLTGLNRFSLVTSVRAVNGTLVSAAAVTTVALGGSLDEVLLSQLMVGSICFLYLVGAAIRTNGRWLVPRIHRQTFATMARYSGFVFLAGLAYQLMMQGPPTVLAAHVGTGELAAFAVPAIVAQQLAVLATSASLGFFPLASAAAASPDRRRLSAIFRSHMRMTVLVMGTIAGYLVVFADQILTAWISSGFAADAADPLRFLAGVAFVLALSGPPADVARGLGRPSWIVIYCCAAAALEIAFAGWLVSSHGATGVAAAMCLGLAVATAPLITVVSARLLTIPWRSLVSALAPVLVTVGATAALYQLGAQVADGFVSAVLVGLAVTGASAVIAYRYVLIDSERQALSVWRRIRPDPEPAHAPT